MRGRLHLAYLLGADGRCALGGGGIVSDSDGPLPDVILAAKLDGLAFRHVAGGRFRLQDRKRYKRTSGTGEDKNVDQCRYAD